MRTVCTLVFHKEVTAWPNWVLDRWGYGVYNVCALSGNQWRWQECGQVHKLNTKTPSTSTGSRQSMKFTWYSSHVRSVQKIKCRKSKSRSESVVPSYWEWRYKTSFKLLFLIWTKKRQSRECPTVWWSGRDQYYCKNRVAVRLVTPIIWGPGASSMLYWIKYFDIFMKSWHSG